MRIELRAETPEDTRSVGEAVASLLQAGDVVALTGELGAGKTTFVQGSAGELGVKSAVVSPTFTLVRQYRGRLPVYHVDVFRLDRIQDVLDLGLEEAADAVMFVEWGDVIEALLPESYLLVEITAPEEGEARHLVLTGVGPAWATRWERLERVTEPWGSAA